MPVLLVASPIDAEQTRELKLELAGGDLAGESNTFRFQEGEAIRILWTSDRAVELHLHGYDIEVEAGPDLPGEMRFTGSVPGRFPVTLHDASGGHSTVLYVEIHPR